MVVDEVKIVVQAEVASAIAKLTQLDNVNKSNHKTGLDLAKSIAGYTTGYGLAVRAAQTVLTTTANLVTTSVKLAAAQERVRMEFAVLTGSMVVGNKLFDEMNRLAAQTPLELENLTAAGKQLLSVRVPVEEVTKTLRMLGDVAMGNPEKLDRLTMAFGQLKSKGVASMEQLNRFIEAGVPIMAELEKQTGKSGDEVFKLVSQGKIGFRDVETALKNLTGEGGLYHDMMKQVSVTAEGKFSTALDNANLRLAEMGKKLLPIAISALDTFNKVMDDFSLKDLLTDISKGVKRDGESIAQALAGLNKKREEYAQKGDDINRRMVEKQIANLEKLAKDAEALESRNATARGIVDANNKKREAQEKAIADRIKAQTELKEFQAALESMLWDEKQENLDNELSKIKDIEEARKKAVESAGKEVEDKNAAYLEFHETLRTETAILQDQGGMYLANLDYVNKLIEAEERRKQLETEIAALLQEAGIASLEAMGEALVNGEKGLESMKDVAKDTFSSLLRMLGMELAARAAAAYPVVPAMVALGAASGAAFVASGAIKAMAEGGAGITTGPTLFFAEKAGEPFAFGGANNKLGMKLGGGATYNTVNQYIGGSVIAEREVKQLAVSGIAQASRGY